MRLHRPYGLVPTSFDPFGNYDGAAALNKSSSAITHKNKITGEPAWLPGRLQSNRRTQMGKAKRTRISQRMSQHIMQLKLALRIMASKEITY